jgi:hypothetical protein
MEIKRRTASLEDRGSLTWDVRNAWSMATP